MTRVWDSGEYSGGTLLVLLALCDWANDKGEKVFPYLDTLAEKARLSEKQTRRTLETLIEDGVVVDIGGVGIARGTVLNLRLNLRAKSFRDKMSLPDTDVPDAGQTKPDAGTFAPDLGTKVLPYIDNPPSEPSRESPSNPPSTAVAVCGPSDLELAIVAFNDGADQCPKWTHCRQMTVQRRKVIDARLKEAGLDGWRRAVGIAASSGFLGGGVPTSGEHRNWRLDIAWFAKAENFAKILEGKYPVATRSSSGLDSAFAGIQDFLDAQGPAH